MEEKEQVVHFIRALDLALIEVHCNLANGSFSRQTITVICAPFLPPLLRPLLFSCFMHVALLSVLLYMY